MTPDTDPRGEDPLASLHRVVDAYRLHEGSVRRLCTRYLGDAEAAADATQETFARAAVALRGRRPEVLSSYLHGIARNVCRDEIRRRMRGGRATEATRTLLTAADPAELAIGAAFVNDVWRRLPVRDRALLLHRFAGYSSAEIAQRLRLSVGAVEVALTRARARARRSLEGLSGLVAWLLRPWRRRAPAGRGRARRPARVLHRVRWSATMKLATALATVPALCAVPALWQVAGMAPSAERGSVPADILATAALSGAMSDPIAGVQVSSLAVDPGEGRSGVVYASGHRVGCASACPVLVRSGDGGHSWTALPGRGFAGGTLLLSPESASGSPILSAGPAGLQRSDDGGRSFRTVAPRGPADVAPRSGAGGELVAVGAQRIVLYHAGSGAVTSGPALPGGVQVGAISFTGDGAHLLVAALDVRPGMPRRTSLLRCGLAGSCQRVLDDQDAGSLHLLRLPAAAGGLTAISSSSRLDLASADGTSLRSVHLPTAGELLGLTTAPGGPVGVRLVAAFRRTPGAPVQLGASADLGGNVVLMPRSTVPAATTAFTVTPDGHVVAAVSGADAVRDDGLRCSPDGGTTWRTRC